jgi:hypothetical protein
MSGLKLVPRRESGDRHSPKSRDYRNLEISVQAHGLIE